MVFMFSLIPALVFGLFSIPAYAAASVQPPGLSLIPMVLVFAVFYFFIIRPHRKKMKEHEVMLGGIKPGDKIVTSSGIVGTVISVEDAGVSAFIVEISPGVRVSILRSHVSDLFSRISAARSVDKTSNTKPSDSNDKTNKANGDAR